VENLSIRVVEHTIISPVLQPLATISYDATRNAHVHGSVPRMGVLLAITDRVSFRGGTLRFSLFPYFFPRLLDNVWWHLFVFLSQIWYKEALLESTSIIDLCSFDVFVNRIFISWMRNIALAFPDWYIIQWCIKSKFRMVKPRSASNRHCETNMNVKISGIKSKSYHNARSEDRIRAHGSLSWSL